MTARLRTAAVLLGLSTLCVAGATSASEQARVNGDEHPGNLPASVAAVLPTFYAERDNAPAWFGEDGRPYRATGALLELLEGAGAEGLDPEHYRVGELRERLGQVAHAQVDPSLDVLLTGMMLTYAQHLHGGRVPPRNAGWRSAAPAPDLLRVAHEVASGEPLEEVLGSLAPQEPHYARLRERLAQLHRLAEDGLPEVPAVDLLGVGDRDDAIAAIRERLVAEGYEAPAPSSGSDLFDEGLEKAVRAFQERHGLKADGLVGSSTLRVLQRSVEDLIRQVGWNMERLRWLDRDRGERHIFVNSAGFVAEVRSGGKTLWMTPVIVGQEGWRTPMFSDQVDGVELYPRWVVPRSIAREELAPALRQDPSYAHRRQFQVIDRGTGQPVNASKVDWSQSSVDSYLFIQSPGPHNPLGEAKIKMQNRFAIYLHGTKNPELFEAQSRAFSHGCIRVQEVLRLTQWMFESEGRTAELEDAIDSGERVTLELQEPVQVDIVYLTAWVDDDGRLHTRPDIYGRDRTLCRALDDCP
jgi:L,D-transpeptidase YcbB